MLRGSLRKSRSRIRPEAQPQPPRITARSTAWASRIRTRSARRARRTRTTSRAPRAASRVVASATGPLPGPPDLFPEVGPDGVVDLAEPRGLVDVEDVPGPGMGTSRISLMRPGALVKMAIRSERAMASTRSWVTKITVRPVPCQSWSSSSWRRSRVWASRGPSGSSMRMTFTLSSTRVRTMEARFRIPPDSSWG